LKLTRAAIAGRDLVLDDVFIEGIRKMLVDASLDAAFREQAILLPSKRWWPSRWTASIRKRSTPRLSLLRDHRRAAFACAS
jgi:hypothetical protein